MHKRLSLLSCAAVAFLTFGAPAFAETVVVKHVVHKPVVKRVIIKHSRPHPRHVTKIIVHKKTPD